MKNYVFHSPTNFLEKTEKNEKTTFFGLPFLFKTKNETVFSYCPRFLPWVCLHVISTLQTVDQHDVLVPECTRFCISFVQQKHMYENSLTLSDLLPNYIFDKLVF